MSIKSGVISSTILKKSTPGVGPHAPLEFATSEQSQLESAFPLGSVFDAFVTNVHDVPQLRFFMFVMNPASAQHFANVCYAATPPNAYKCLRMPREGHVFAVRLGESTLLRAVRLRTMCITKQNEVFLPDIGLNHELTEDELEMYHLPAKLRDPPGLAVLCQLRGVNDDVTILPKNMRTFLRGLLFRSVKLRVDGYCGDMLKVQLLGVTMDKLLLWTKSLGEEENNFSYALKHTVLYKPKNLENEPHEEKISGSVNSCIRRKEKALSPIAEIPCSSKNEDILNDENPTLTTTLTLSNSLGLASSFPSANKTNDLNMTITSAKEKKASLISSTISSIATLAKNTILNMAVFERKDTVKPESNSLYFENLKNLTIEKPTIDVVNDWNRRPLLGRLNTQMGPKVSGGRWQLSDNSWKRDVLPALFLVDNRHLKLNYSREELLTITPTYIGQLEMFFGIIHRRDECYMQHMWTDEEIPMPSRYTGSRTPYIFDVVLAKHSGDFKWYRAKVIKTNKEERKVQVFFVDYGGVEYVDLWNIAHLGRKISKLPFQAVLFRLHDLVDMTTAKAERDFGVDFLRMVLFKKTLTVRVVNNRNDELTICFEDQRFSHVPATLIRWGLMQHSNAI